MKLLNGSELSEFIEERQAREVRALRQAHQIFPKLAIIVTVDNPIINVYMRMKQRYGAEMQVEVDIHRITVDEAPEAIKKLNEDDNIHGIIIQLPLSDPARTDEIVSLVDPEKDVDGLGPKARYDPATAMAILWLLSAYNIEIYKGQNVLLIGRGKLVGGPLEKILNASAVNLSVADRETADLKAMTLEADVIITATGSPAVLRPDMVKDGAVVVDAGVASEGGKTVGDLAPEMYERSDLTITPAKGGVGPLTVCSLFENVIQAAKRRVVVEPKTS